MGFKEAVENYLKEHPDVDVSESNAYYAYMNGKQTAEQIAQGYQNGTIKPPPVVAHTDPDSWYSDDWMNTRINPWTYTPGKPDAEVATIRAARDASFQSAAPPPPPTTPPPPTPPPTPPVPPAPS